MIPDGAYTAVVDRFEEELAVLELSDDDDELYELIVEKSDLPDPAAHVDAVCQVTVRDEELAEVEFKPDETETRKENAQSRFDRLSRRPPDEESED